MVVLGDVDGRDAGFFIRVSEVIGAVLSFSLWHCWWGVWYFGVSYSLDVCERIIIDWHFNEVLLILFYRFVFDEDCGCCDACSDDG